MEEIQRGAWRRYKASKEMSQVKCLKRTKAIHKSKDSEKQVYSPALGCVTPDARSRTG